MYNYKNQIKWRLSYKEKLMIIIKHWKMIYKTQIKQDSHLREEDD